jgi:ribonuclease D
MENGIPEIISTPAELEKLAEHLARQALVGVDTESNSLHAYREQVCMIQFSTNQADYLVDPLALSDLSPLAEVFASPRVEKVFHAAEYDLICLKRDFGFQFANLFDTMWAARILGWKEIGLGAVLEKEFGVQVEKKYQRADWGKRPITRDMANYARKDTHYLLMLRNRLRAELEQTGRLALAREDFKRLERINERDPQPNGKPNAPWERINGARDLTPQQTAILKELSIFRERVASDRDRPVFKVIGDATLVEIAMRAPTSLEALQQTPKVSPRQVQSYGTGLVRAVQAGLKSPPLFPPAPGPRPENGYLMRLDAIRNWRKTEAGKLGVESDIVLPRDLMLEIVQQDPRSPEAVREILKDVPWRAERYGQSLVRLLERIA